MSVPQELPELVERFNTNREAYRSGQYNETQLRREFIDSFFQLLGWDVNNEKGYAEAYKDVIHEDSIKIGGLTKAPDYCFRIGGVRKFFVETKRPSVNIKEDIDPACGSGSFLLGAYQYLLDWHRDWYVANDPEKWATGRSPTLYQVADSNPQYLAEAEKSPLGSGPRGGFQNPKLVLDSDLSPTQRGDLGSKIGNWRLTTAERRRILLNNIYGVDIDPQAVEVTKLSLLLKVLEGESEQTIVKQLKLFHERALPDLGNNIKCGNSLIGTDFYNTPHTPPVSEYGTSFFRGEKMDSPLARGAGGCVR